MFSLSKTQNYRGEQMHTVDLIPIVLVLGAILVSSSYLLFEFVKARKV